MYSVGKLWLMVSIYTMFKCVSLMCSHVPANKGKAIPVQALRVPKV